ncbi:MAG: flagellar hook protein FlgE [Phycisphaerae bacterium]|jgi:flagellar hook protein FlgE
MASTTALFTGLSGLNANSRNLDVIGNNIANVNTTAFKSSRLMFSNMFSRNMRAGTAPAETTGGTNPYQIGLGVAISGTQRNMTGGTISASGDARDLAIDGNGFFVVQRGETQYYTRAGAFRQNAINELTDISGNRVLGYGVDDEFNIIPGILQPLEIPTGQLTIAQATQTARIGGNLNANGSLPTGGSRLALGGSDVLGFRAIAGATPAPGAGNVLESTTRLIDIEDPGQPGSGATWFNSGQTFELRNVSKGTRLLPAASLEITATTTVQELMTFLTQSLGINTTVGNNPDGGTPGVSVDPTTGFINIIGNTGTSNDIQIQTADARLVNADGSIARYPFVPTKSASADGESKRTAFVAFDSLGTPVEIDVTMTMESRGDAGTTWRYYVESGDNATTGLAVTSGTISFDNEGRLVTRTPASITVNRTNSGAVTPLNFEFEFGGGDDTLSSLTDTTSEIAITFRDGAPIGTLTSYAVGLDGTIEGTFSNGLIRTLGQVALATFTNTEGLVDEGGNLFLAGANSGTPVITTPGQMGAGFITAGALELSNVDIGEEFIKMILTSTGYSANSRVIRTADELMQQLLVLGR